MVCGKPGFTLRIVGDDQRLQALRELGCTETEVVVVDISETDELALNVASNSRHAAGELYPIGYVDRKCIL